VAIALSDYKQAVYLLNFILFPIKISFSF